LKADSEGIAKGLAVAEAASDFPLKESDAVSLTTGVSAEDML
jgi:hypothetical protein